MFPKLSRQSDRDQFHPTSSRIPVLSARKRLDADSQYTQMPAPCTEVQASLFAPENPRCRPSRKTLHHRTFSLTYSLRHVEAESKLFPMPRRFRCFEQSYFLAAPEWMVELGLP